MKKVDLFLLLMMSMLISFQAHSQSIRIIAPSSVQLGEAFQVSVEVEGADLDNLKLPDFNGFEIVGGPMRSSSVSIINGQMSKKASLSYELLATKKGKFPLKPASIVSNGKTITSNAITIEVGGQAKVDKAFAGTDVFIKIETSPSQTQYYVGQQIMVKYVVYYNQSIQFNNFVSEPGFEHFFVQKIELTDNERSTIQLNGKVYSKAVISAQAIFPQKEGKWEVGKLVSKFGVEDGVSDSGFFASTRYKPLVLESNNLVFDIKRLPEGAPASFSGAVGDYKFKAEADKKTIALNETLKLNISIEGNGDHKLIQGPKLSLGTDLEIYDANKVDEQIDYDGQFQFHRTIFQYNVVPTKSAEFNISPEFTYFDPIKGQYLTVNSDSIQFTVTPAVGVLDRNDDAANNEVVVKQSLPSWAYGLMGAATFGLLGFVAFIIIGKFKKSNLDHGVLNKHSKHKLENTKTSIPEVSRQDFYKQLPLYLHTIIAELNKSHQVPMTTMGMVEAVNTLKGQELGIKTKAILVKCEEKSFYDNGSLDDRKELLDQSLALITALR